MQHGGLPSTKVPLSLKGTVSKAWMKTVWPRRTESSTQGVLLSATNAANSAHPNLVFGLTCAFTGTDRHLRQRRTTTTTFLGAQNVCLKKTSHLPGKNDVLLAASHVRVLALKDYLVPPRYPWLCRGSPRQTLAWILWYTVKQCVL